MLGSPETRMSGPSPTHPEGSDQSPLTAQDSRTGCFSSPLSSPRLDSIPEHVEAQNVQCGGDAENVSARTSVSSITFHFAALPKGVPKHRKDRIRTSSPPAPSRFEHHVSFDNFGGGEQTEKNINSFTLNVKHIGYKYQRRSRTFMIGIDENSYSDYALQWMLEELVDDGDEIVCLRVVDRDAKISSDKSLERKQYQEEAKQLMQLIQAKNDEHRAISIILEFAVGKLHTTFQKMIQLYEPSMLIVGTKGRSLGGFQGLVSNRNSFSKWCLQYSPIPVVVVRPTEKRDKKKLKRANDPTRQNYLQILQESTRGIHEANSYPSGSISEGEIFPANSPDEEAQEVAAALGLPSSFSSTARQRNREASPFRKDQRRENCVRPSTPGDQPASPGLLKSPKSPDLESPMLTEEDSEDENEGEFEAVPAHVLLSNDRAHVEKQQKLHQMEVGEAAALAWGRKGRKASVGGNDSSSPPIGDADEDEEDGGIALTADLPDMCTVLERE